MAWQIVPVFGHKSPQTNVASHASIDGLMAGLNMLLEKHSFIAHVRTQGTQMSISAGNMVTPMPPKLVVAHKFAPTWSTLETGFSFNALMLHKMPSLKLAFWSHHCWDTVAPATLGRVCSFARKTWHWRQLLVGWRFDFERPRRFQNLVAIQVNFQVFKLQMRTRVKYYRGTNLTFEEMIARSFAI